VAVESISPEAEMSMEQARAFRKLKVCTCSFLTCSLLFYCFISNRLTYVVRILLICTKQDYYHNNKALVG
jgi:hypothetical protein